MSVKQIQGYSIYLSQVLGRGSFGNVYKGLCEEKQQQVAVKIIPKELIDYDQYLQSSLKNQIKILQAVKSVNVVGFYDVMESSKNYYIIQELCDGDLSSIIRSGQQLPQKKCIDILSQICNGFLSLVRQGIIHRDLKPANVMKRGNVFKLGDFGFSKQLNKISSKNGENIQNLKMKSTVGTPLYMSIEILKSLEYSSKCDIWALGFIFYEMLHGQTPWNATRQYELVKNIETIPLKIKRKDLSNQTIDFLKKCLQIYEKDRMSWNQIFRHPIFEGKFESQADQNAEYQNQMKSIMTKLRHYFRSNKVNLQKFLIKYGFTSNNDEMAFEQYFEFLKAVNPSITQFQAIYIFKKTDIDNSGTISIDEILEMLGKYGIGLQIGESQFYKSEQKIDPMKANPEIAQEKIKSCFIKLNKIITKNNLTLERVFKDFAKTKKNTLNSNQFKNMVQKLSKQITQQEALRAFEMIDTDHSNSVQFDELKKCFQFYNQM